jgi:rubrerythrin
MATRIKKLVNRTIVCRICDKKLHVLGPRRNFDLMEQLAEGRKFTWEYHYYEGTGWYSEGWRCPSCNNRKNLWNDF